VQRAPLDILASNLLTLLSYALWVNGLEKDKSLALSVQQVMNVVWILRSGQLSAPMDSIRRVDGRNVGFVPLELIAPLESQVRHAPLGATLSKERPLALFALQAISVGTKK
jgi:hypothetical protein